MEIKFSRIFKKQFKKLPAKQQTQCYERIELWQREPTHPLLRIHPLVGSKLGYWSVNVSGDLRVIFYYENDNIVVLAFTGTHSQLYR